MCRRKVEQHTNRAYWRTSVWRCRERLCRPLVCMHQCSRSQPRHLPRRIVHHHQSWQAAAAGERKASSGTTVSTVAGGGGREIGARSQGGSKVPANPRGGDSSLAKQPQHSLPFPRLVPHPHPRHHCRRRWSGRPVGQEGVWMGGRRGCAQGGAAHGSRTLESTCLAVPRRSCRQLINAVCLSPTTYRADQAGITAPANHLQQTGTVGGSGMSS